MLVFVAGNNPVYGEQSLFFMDKVFVDRSKVKAPEETQTVRKRLIIDSEIRGEQSYVKDFSLGNKLTRQKTEQGLQF
ncbi:hypothetical protein HGD77_16635 (plasmid) [Acinetobacter sp. NEB149]|uniref:hypothetical protein n=1 Tax=Acinetobacter sp. NEB149 TaxID=2725684 RepID=UPI001449DDC2|nr:hypothetical protein [Acinetobacter sp. NEB149]QJB50220.1 hypothetical protein HGD77_16635 [Acinetobacter sp. NEB149]